MDYKQFVSAIEVKVKKHVKDELRVSIHTTIKNNGKERKGLKVMEVGINISPTIYLEEYYEQFKKGSSIDQIVEKLMELYQEVKFQSSWEGSVLKTLDNVKTQIAYKVINYKKNKDMLEVTPHTRYLDLAIVFYVLLEINQCGTATLLIKNDHLEMWGATKEEIEQLAKNNSEKLLPAEFKTMVSVIEEMLQLEECEKNEVEEDTMYVLSNQIRNFGASSILYEGVLEEIGEQLKENFYVLPSSVHEVIIVPESKSPSRKELDHMISEINNTQVEPEEVLSDRAYYYNRKEARLLY